MTTILAIDDTSYNLDILELALQEEGYDVLLADSSRLGLQRIERDQPDLVLLDVKMPEMDGIAVLERIRGHRIYHYLPVIMLTADTRDETLAQCLNAGANDFVTKPVDLVDLNGRIENALKLSRFRRETAGGDPSSVVTPATTDPVTGLLRRQPFMEITQDIFLLPRRPGKYASLALLELDHFDWIGETLGQEAGNTVLAALGRLLHERLRHSDILGRLGEMEFAVYMPNTRAVQAFATIEALRIQLNELELIRDTSGQPVPVSFSSGIAMFTDHPDFDTLFSEANAALDRAKSRGRNKTIFNTNVSQVG